MIAVWWGLAVAAPGVADELTTAWAEARADPAWRSPTRAEREAVTEGLRLLAEAAPTCATAARDRAAEVLAAAELRVEPLGEVGWLVREGDERRGAGLFALRCGAAEPLILQAPHGRYDLGTGDLVIALFAESAARAAMWNTVHRYRATPGEVPEDPVHPADVAHQPGSLFHAATLGLAAAEDAARVVQLHGFAGGRLAVDAVVSTGDPDRPPLGVVGRWGELGEVAAFGDTIDQLGGTQNAQRQALPDRFLHVELSPALRERLQTDAGLRARLVLAVGGPW